jgi:hypothetical protein
VGILLNAPKVAVAHQGRQNPVICTRCLQGCRCGVLRSRVDANLLDSSTLAGEVPDTAKSRLRPPSIELGLGVLDPLKCLLAYVTGLSECS